jgi:hypothetical protein
LINLCFFFVAALFWRWCLKASDGGNKALTPSGSVLVGVLGRWI